jgi:hypothetical protein
MKTYGGVGVWLHAFLTLGLDGGEWSVSRPCCFNAGAKAPDTQWIGGWVGPRVGMDAVAEIKSPFTALGESEP